MQEIKSYEPNTKLKGLAAVNGLVMGVSHIYSRGNININPEPLDTGRIDEEIKKFEQALEGVGMEMQSLTDFASGLDDSDTESILQTQYEVLHDPEMKASVIALIRKKRIRAEKAIYDAFQKYIDLIKSSNKSFLITRLSDLRDVRDRLIRSTQQLTVISRFGKDAIIITDEVSPLEVVAFARNGVLGIICNSGGLTSHASIIANAMGVPMIIGTHTATRQARTGDVVILNGYEREVILRPDKETTELYKQEINRHNEEEKLLRKVINKPAETLCGVQISLQANIDFAEEILNVDKFRAEGIGLLRTDTLLMNSGTIGMDRKRQELFCQNAFSIKDSSSITIRLLDVGGDKLLDIKNQEANPFLGWRGVRILLDKRELLRSQLEAICRVAGQHPGRTRLLVPMVSTLDEFIEVKHEIEQTQHMLKCQNVPVDEKIRIGVMVEVPSVAIQIRLFAKHVDFLSIGTNDLTQYTLAVDRGNNLISSLYQPLHPSVLTLIAMAVNAGKENQIPVAVCGELASDPFAAQVLIGLGIYELSMTPRLIPGVKQAIRLFTFDEMKKLADNMLLCNTLKEISKIREEWEQQYSEKRSDEKKRQE
ncbi:MAG: phosphoenolpyruvate--protein phosphotransferase [Balneolales bacterium]